MNWFIIGASFDVVGKVLIGIAVLLVHQHIIKEHKIDKDVIKQMGKEKIISGLGILFIILGYIIHVMKA